jgi:hypothetical protein
MPLTPPLWPIVLIVALYVYDQYTWAQFMLT